MLFHVPWTADYKPPRQFRSSLFIGPFTYKQITLNINSPPAIISCFRNTTFTELLYKVQIKD